MPYYSIFPHLFIGQIFIEHLLYVRMVLVAGDMDMNKIDKNSCIHGAYILERDNVKKNILWQKA